MNANTPSTTTISTMPDTTARVAASPTADAPVRAAWPEPAEENVSHGDGKKKLRVAVICDTDGDRTYLKSALEKCGLHVVAILPFERIPNVATDFNNADILFVDLNENIDQELQQLDHLLEQCQLPVLYSDSSDTRLGLADTTGNFGKRLTLKLASLVRH